MCVHYLYSITALSVTNAGKGVAAMMWTVVGIGGLDEP